MGMTFNLQTGWTDPCNRQNLSNVLAVKVAQTNETGLSRVNEFLHCTPGSIYVIFHQDHFTTQVLLDLAQKRI
jgi:hypothetical protein